MWPCAWSVWLIFATFPIAGDLVAERVLDPVLQRLSLPERQDIPAKGRDILRARPRTCPAGVRGAPRSRHPTRRFPPRVRRRPRRDSCGAVSDDQLQRVYAYLYSPQSLRERLCALDVSRLVRVGLVILSNDRGLLDRKEARLMRASAVSAAEILPCLQARPSSCHTNSRLRFCAKQSSQMIATMTRPFNSTW